MMKKKIQLPYGAVYFRKSNPPSEDWENDYKVAHADGNNVFRHWFMWGSIEIAPGQYDWSDYDRQMDLAAENNMQTIVAEIIQSAPEWAVSRFAHGLAVHANGAKAISAIGGSTNTGGFNHGSVLCLDCEEVKEAAGNFLKALATRYKDHPAMLGYDVWNECSYAPNACYCEHTQAKFRLWLERRYGSLDKLAKAWQRYSYTEWSQVQAPVQIGPYTECIDWLQFKKEHYYEQMQWRIDTIRSVDPDNRMTAHGLAGSLSQMASGGADDWLAASKVEQFGFTWVQSRKGNEPWKQWHAVDLVRSASRGKPFWHAEMQGGPLWLQPQVIGRAKHDGRVTEPEDIRLWNMISLAGGARGLLSPRWRPLMDGPLFGAFGSYGMDGSRTPRSQMGSTIAKWANAPEQADLLQAAPVRGELGILVVPEVQEFDYLMRQNANISLYGSSLLYSEAMWGAYRGFFDTHIQADWVHIDHIDEYDTLYFPYPIMFTAEQADRIAAWVEQGGTLICEGCPAYFGDRGKVGKVQPNLGLHQVFGAIESDVEFMPDTGNQIRFTLNELNIQGGGFLQAYQPTGGTARGWYADGRVAVVENQYGRGRTLLIGTHPSIGYYNGGADSDRQLFTWIMEWTNKKQRVQTDNPSIQARLQEGEGKRYMWLINPERTSQETTIRIDAGFGQTEIGEWLWGRSEVSVTEEGFSVQIPGRDALIFELKLQSAGS